MKKIAIIGAGISGLFFANLLKNSSEYDFTIFEKRTSIDTEDGYGIQLSVNSIKLLNEIGFNNLDKKDISYRPVGKFEETRFEKIHNVIFDSSLEASILVAQEIATLIRTKQSLNESCVLGLATGSSPIKVYEELVRMHKEDGLSFANVITFNLDEYYQMDRSNIQSYYYFMHEHLFNHIDILSENINIPDGKIGSEDLYQYCIDYEIKIITTFPIKMLS